MPHDEFRPLGPNRFACSLTTPWGQAVPAEVIVTTRRGWRDRPESRDARWSAFPIGPAVIAIRIKGSIPRAPSVPTPKWPIPAEWN